MKAAIFYITLMAGVFGVSCSHGDNEHDKAAAVFEQIETARQAGDYRLTMALLDTLDQNYTAEVELRRKAMPNRAWAIEAMTLDSIPKVDLQIARAEEVVDRLNSTMTTAGEGNESYQLPANWPDRGDIMAEGIEPRIDRNSFFRLVIKSQNKPIGLSGLSFESGVSSITSGAVAENRLATVGNSEMLSLSQEEFQPLAEWLEQHAGDTDIKAMITGQTGSRSIKFTPEMAAGLVQTWQLAMSRQQLYELSKERARLERQLQIARDQAASFRE